MTHSYDITGMTCTSCVARIKDALLKLGNVTSADVQLAAPQATITMQQHIPVAALQQAIGTGRYVITEATGHATVHAMTEEATDAPSYYPIFLIFGYITGIALLVEYTRGHFHLMYFMSNFMAGFFLLFSFFKLLSLKGFAEGYGTYDIIAKKIPAYGYIYPFIELLLGVAFLARFAPLFTNIATLAVMGISTIGVAQSLLRKTTFQCACLGTIIKLPLSKVTLFEDLLMVAMSALMILQLTGIL